MQLHVSAQQLHFPPARPPRSEPAHLSPERRSDFLPASLLNTDEQAPAGFRRAPFAGIVQTRFHTRIPYSALSARRSPRKVCIPAFLAPVNILLPARSHSRRIDIALARRFLLSNSSTLRSQGYPQVLFEPHLNSHRAIAQGGVMPPLRTSARRLGDPASRRPCPLSCRSEAEILLSAGRAVLRGCKAAISYLDDPTLWCLRTLPIPPLALVHSPVGFSRLPRSEAGLQPAARCPRTSGHRRASQSKRSRSAPPRECRPCARRRHNSPMSPLLPDLHEPFSIFPIPNSQIPIPNSPRWSEMQYLYNETCGCPVLQFTGGRNSCHRFSRNGRRENHLGRHRRTPPHGHTPSLI